ncbi:MAG: TlpA family protein disulfide reductase [Candidatus Eisenbacteria bacterium]|nr:TlpA family protein disulfide reductase [Candidatus Eisenbacteria bacterium]
MPLVSSVSIRCSAVLALFLLAPLAHAQAPATPAATPTTTTAPAAPAPAPPSQGIRNKLSAGDLPSAESILEVYRDKNGEDASWLNGLAWLARGALLLGDLPKAQAYATDVRARALKQLGTSRDIATAPDIETPLGAAIEVEAQRLERTRGKRAAVDYLRGEIATFQGPTGFRSRLHKRLAMLTWVGAPAPEIVPERTLGEGAATLAALKGKPVVVFGFDKYCGDCKGQAATLKRAFDKHRAAGVRMIALTRHYEQGDSLRAAEFAKVDSVWADVYAGLADVPRVVSTASMIQYGVSSTPTFVFIDRQGIVRRYTPTRLTEAELDREMAAIAR